jgi:hypothetical protein
LGWWRCFTANKCNNFLACSGKKVGFSPFTCERLVCEACFTRNKLQPSFAQVCTIIFLSPPFDPPSLTLRPLFLPSVTLHYAVVRVCVNVTLICGVARTIYSNCYSIWHGVGGWVPISQNGLLGEPLDVTEHTVHPLPFLSGGCPQVPILR